MNKSTLNKIADIYYDSYHKDMPRRLKDKISMEMLQNIFEKMVVPALEGAVNNHDRLLRYLNMLLNSDFEKSDVTEIREALASMEKEG